MLLSRAVSFLMLPVYTRYLTTADYGVLQLLDMTVDISYVLFAAGMTAGMSIFYFAATSDKERGDIVRTAFAAEMVLVLIGSAVVFASAPQIWQNVLKGAGEPLFVRIAAVSFTFQMLSAVPMALLQIQQRAKAVMTLSLARLTLQLTLNIVFIVVLKLGVMGILLSTLTAGVLQGTGLLIWLRRAAPGHVRMPIVHRLREFGVPLQISAIGGFLLSFGDRFVLEAHHGPSAVGLYALAYQFGFLLSQLTSEPMIKAWAPQRILLASEPREVRDKRYNLGLSYFNLILITVATGIGVFVQPVIRVMTTAPFHPAARLVPVILAAYVVQGWGEATGFGIALSRKTEYHTFTTWISVGVVAVLYGTLIPRYGGMGAAVATLGAFMVRTALLYHWSQQVWPVTYRMRRNVLLTMYGATAVVVAYAAPEFGILRQAAFSCLLVAIYAVLAWKTVLERDDRQLVKRIIRSPRQLSLVFGNRS